jgi:DNA-binding transcriptional MerR regulator
VLRYYKKEGLLPRVGRTRGGIRHYTDKGMEWLGLVCCLKNTGMSLRQIRDFVSLSLQGPRTLKKRCELLETHRKEVAQNIAGLQRHLEIVIHKIAYFTGQHKDYLARAKL